MQHPQVRMLGMCFGCQILAKGTTCRLGIALDFQNKTTCFQAVLNLYQC